MKIYSFVRGYKTISKVVVLKHQLEDADIISRVKGIVADETFGNIRDIPSCITQRFVKGGFAVEIHYNDDKHMIVLIEREETETIVTEE